MLLALALCASVPLFAAPLVLKDDYRSPRNVERARRKATTLIVLHTTEAHAKSSLNKLSERGEAHYCVVEDGTVYRIIDRDREAFHAGRSMWQGKDDCDEFSIGIEVVGHHDQAVTFQQLDALRELIARLKRIYSIPDARVVCHSHIAYGAPNAWHKKKHRGRKRCGMIFAMPSVRSRLGLTVRPASDPDVRAKRLVQADADLADVLYGSRDTMVSTYGRSPKPVAARPAPAKPQAQPVVATTPSPIVKPAHPKYVEQPPKEKEDTGVLAGIGGFFKSTAKLIVPKKKKPPSPPEGSAHAPSGPSDPPPPRKLARPPQILTRDPRDFAALEAMHGYIKGGPVSAELTPYRIAGAAWRAPTTYYYMNGRIVTGDKVNEKLIEKGSYIFYKSESPEKR